jgi:hypothetical protein
MNNRGFGVVEVIVLLILMITIVIMGIAGLYTLAGIGLVILIGFVTTTIDKGENK